MSTDIFSAPSTSLEDLLEARERRAAKQSALIAKFKCTIVCFTLNIPGPVKRFTLADAFISEGMRIIENQLNFASMKIVWRESVQLDCGIEGYIAVRADARAVKRLTAEIEDSFPAARLFDIDVLRENGTKIEGSEIGRAPRKCLLCDEAAAVCARSRAHSLDDVRRRTQELISEYFNDRDANKISAAAARALMYEVCATPKPGLVDRENNGAHKDMDVFTFMDSIAVITPWLRKFALAGLRSIDDGLSPEALFNAIRYPGRLAEADMLDATHGVNTHKGAIFSIGVLCAAIGRLCANRTGSRPNAEKLFAMCRDMTARPLREELAYMSSDEAVTRGERLFLSHGVAGVRGEVATGFPAVREHGLPLMQKLLSNGQSLNDAGTRVLLMLMANTDDTNLAARANVDAQRELRREICELIENSGHDGITDELLRDYDIRFIKENLSPGGSADLLAVCYFFVFLEEAKLI